MNKISPTAAPAGATTEQSQPDIRNVHQRLHAVMQEVDYVQKDRGIGTGTNSYKVVTHDAVTAKVRPVLVKHGLVYYPQNLRHVQNGNRTEVTLDIVFVNINNPADFVAVPTLGYGIDPSDKGPGKALSYAVKMALLKALGLETGEDADDNTDVKHVKDTLAPPAPDATERTMTKPQARPEYAKLVNEMQQMQSVIDLEKWGATNKARMSAMPPDWQQSLRDEYVDHKRTIEQRTAS